ncbi:AMP-binding protein [Thermopolyspora sp. NPDC052614]|uniref:AMP-binding protein n=1 Tax=Thermopolyspora sp. NPDC052614 TaxID=3155682 RepID=UPI003427931D
MTEPAIHSGARSRPISEARTRAARLAAGLRRLGVGHGDRFALVLRNEIAFLEATMAATPIGAVPVPVNWHWTGVDLEHLLNDSGAKVVIAHSDLLPGVEKYAGPDVVIIEAEVPPEVAETYRLGDVPLSGRHTTMERLIEDNEPVQDPVTRPPMSVIYTSGTTGLAKGILRDPIDAASMPRLVASIAKIFGMRPGGSTLITAPMYHTAPNVQATFAVAMGLDVHVMPAFRPELWLRLIAEHRIESVQMVPTMFQRLLRLPEETRRSYDLSSLRAVVHAAAPCPIPVKEAMIDWLGPIVAEYYGGSEGGIWTYATSEDSLSHPGTVGRPFAEADIRILDPDGRPVPTGGTGIVYGKAIAGWPNFTYLHQPDKRAAIEQDGYITVGDIGRVDEDGFLYLSDRLNDVIVAGGVNIYPAEIEAAILELDAVADVAVFGIPDEDLGEAVCAHVELRPGAHSTVEAIQEHVRARLARYKAPKRVVFDESLPREDSGKLFKRRIKALYWPEMS